MIKSFLGTFIILFSLNLWAHVIEVSESEEISGTTIERENLKFNQCDSYRINQLDRSAKLLSSTIDRLQTQVNSYNNTELKKSEMIFLKQVTKTLSCVKKKITQKLTFKCQQNKICDRAAMYVKRILLVPHALQKNTIHVCDGAFDYRNYKLAGVILHEASHLCGTNDLEYLLELEEYNSEPQLNYNYKIKRKDDGIYLKQRILPVRGAKNADSYRYWYHYGFCLPGRDC